MLVRPTFTAATLLAALPLAPAAPPTPKSASPAPRPRLVREPRYTSGAPQYCLLQLGDRSPTHVWLVVDGSTLYVDRNANGDLTEPKEHLVRRKGVFTVGALRERDGRTEHTGIVLKVGQRVPHSDGSSYVLPYEFTVRVRGRYVMSAYPEKFGASAAAAPVVQVNGPLEMRAFGSIGLARGAEKRVDFWILAKGAQAWEQVEHEGVTPDVHPVAEFVFTGETLKEPIWVPVTLDHRC